jgi:hypothetical protein
MNLNTFLENEQSRQISKIIKNNGKNYNKGIITCKFQNYNKIFSYEN